MLIGKLQDGIKAYLRWFDKSTLFKRLREGKEAFYKRAEIKDSSVYTKADNPMSTVNANGGFTVPSELLSDDFFVSIIDRPRLQDVIRNITVSSTQGSIPCITADLTAAIVAENADSTDQKPTFAQRAFSLDKAMALSYVSEELLAGTAIDMIGEITANQITALRRLIENEVSDGSNFTGTVDGTAWQSTAMGGAVTYAGLKDLYHQLAIEYRALPTVWMMHPTNFKRIMKLTGDSRPVYDWNYGYAPEDTRIFGSPVFLNSQVADTSIWFGNWDRAMAIFRHNSGLRIDTSETGGTAWESAQLGMRAYELVDSNNLVNTAVDSSFGGAVVELTGITG
jgi:HK97 family phage major capsid protein